MTNSNFKPLLLALLAAIALAIAILYLPAQLSKQPSKQELENCAYRCTANHIRLAQESGLLDHTLNQVDYENLLYDCLDFCKKTLQP